MRVTDVLLVAYLSLSQVTRSFIGSIEADYFFTNETTVQIGSLVNYNFYLSTASFYGSEVTVTKEFVDVYITVATRSHVNLLGTCKNSRRTSSGQNFDNSFLYCTTACQYPLSEDTLFTNSVWEIENIETSPSVYVLPIGRH